MYTCENYIEQRITCH